MNEYINQKVKELENKKGRLEKEKEEAKREMLIEFREKAKFIEDKSETMKNIFLGIDFGKAVVDTASDAAKITKAIATAGLSEAARQTIKIAVDKLVGDRFPPYVADPPSWAVEKLKDIYREDLEKEQEEIKKRYLKKIQQERNRYNDEIKNIDNEINYTKGLQDFIEKEPEATVQIIPDNDYLVGVEFELPTFVEKIIEDIRDIYSTYDHILDAIDDCEFCGSDF